MRSTDPLSAQQLARLTDLREPILESRIRNGFPLWNPPRARTGKTGRPSRHYLAIDAVHFELGSEFIKQGMRARAVVLAAPGMLLTLSNAVDRPGSIMAVGVLSENELSVIADNPDAVADWVRLTRPKLVWMIWIDPAVEAVRRRARKFKIKLPDKIALPLGERPLWARDDETKLTTNGRAVIRWETDRPLPHERPRLVQMPLEVRA